MACLSNTQLLICGWLLALEKISGMCTLMLSAVLLENRNPWHFLSFTPLLVVTQLLDFLGKEKEAWKSFPEVTRAFLMDPHAPLFVECEHFKLLERFCIVIYDRTSNLNSVNEARKELFCQKSRTMETIPPSPDIGCFRRAAYQAGIWNTSDRVNQEIPSPEGHGWTMDSERKSWAPIWTMPVAPKSCSKLVKCGCKSEKGCAGRCACKKAHWKCTELCSCNCKKSK